MQASLKQIVAALAVSLPLVAFGQTPAAEPAKPADTAAPAAAAPAAEPAKAEPLFTIYGTLNVNLQYSKAGGATDETEDVSPRFGISTDSTNIGIRGTYAVAHGLKVTYQCETAANLDGVGAAGLCGRNSRLGLTGDYGTLFYGNWDTPFKAATYGTKAADPFGNTDVFGFQGIMGSPGFNIRSGTWSGSSAGTAAAAQAGFDLRANNSLAYWSPKFAGALAFKLQYGTDENRSVDGHTQPMLLGGSVNYDAGPLSVNAAVEYHEDAFGLRTIFENAGTSATKDWAWRLAAGYELPLGVGNLTLVGMVEQLKYGQKDAIDGDLESYSRFAWLAGAKFRTGSHELRARYMQAMDPSCDIAGGGSCSDDPVGEEVIKELGASSFSVGYAYFLAKNTEVYAYYMQISNDELAQYTFTIGGASSVAGATPAGASPVAAGLGLKYGF